MFQNYPMLQPKEEGGMMRMEGYYSQMSHTCNYCNKVLPTYGDLVQHKKTHVGDRPFSCHICHKRFTQKAHLNIHKRTHTGEKPYACPICHKRFAQSSHLNSHRRIHADDRPYFCVMCNTGFSQKHRFDAHLPCMQQAKARTSARISAAITSAAASAAGSVSHYPRIVGGGEDADRDMVVDQKPDIRYLESLNQQALIDQLAEFSAASDMSSRAEPREALEEGEISKDGLTSSGSMQGSSREEARSGISAAYVPAMSSHRRKPAYVRHVDNDEGSSSNAGMGSADTGAENCLGNGSSSSVAENNGVKTEEVEEEDNTPVVFQNGASVPKDRDSNNTIGGAAGPMPANLSLLPTRISPLGASNSSDANAMAMAGRTNHRISLVNFTAEELLTHMMSRGDVHRCDFCRLIFQDAAMYHIHRNMHDKHDLRCCNLCGKMLQDRYDFTAHLLNEHR